MKDYPDIYPSAMIDAKDYPLQSILFGHRIQPSQTKYEYLIEFLQVALARKSTDAMSDDFSVEEFFPIAETPDGKFRYQPELRIGLKRFIFLPKSKLDGKAEVDKIAYEKFITYLESQIKGGNELKRKNSIAIIQNLLRGFCAINQSRSWFDQNVLPICPEVVLPEGMGVKKWRQNLEFEYGKPEIDTEFDYHKYTYMCRGGEVYYLHLLNALVEFPEYASTVEGRLKQMIKSFPQFSFLCDFIQEHWEYFYLQDSKDPTAKNLFDYESVRDTAEKIRRNETKKLGVIPAAFSVRNQFTLSELKNFLNSKCHPFEKMESFANGIILQIMRMMYLAAATEQESNCWVIDINCSGYDNAEAKKCAITAFKHNEEVLSAYLYSGLAAYRKLLDPKKDDQTLIKDAANDSYRLFRKLGKMIGIIIPNNGKGMRFSLSEDILKFLVLAIIPPKQMITLDEFVNLLYEHFGMIIGPEQYKEEMERGAVLSIGDVSFLETNMHAFAQKLKDCGFLRDLSDATSIVENPYEMEDSLG